MCRRDGVCGGGNEPLCPFIFRYNALENKWLQLPNTPKANNLTAFALCEVNKSLVAIGGWNTGNGTPSSSLFSYSPEVEPEVEMWKEDLTPFSTPRACPSAASNSNYIVVYGGRSNVKEKSPSINSLEIYDMQLRKWSIYNRLPFENKDCFVSSSSVLTANNILLLANGNEVMWTRLNELIIGNDMQNSKIVIGSRPFANMKSHSVPENLPCQSQPHPEEKFANRSASVSYNQKTQDDTTDQELVVSQSPKYPWIDTQLPISNAQAPAASASTSTKTTPCFPCYTLFGEQIVALLDGKLYVLNINTCLWGAADKIEYLQGCTTVELKTQAKLLLIGGYSRDDRPEKSDKVSQVSFLV